MTRLLILLVLCVLLSGCATTSAFTLGGTVQGVDVNYQVVVQ